MTDALADEVLLKLWLSNDFDIKVHKQESLEQFFFNGYALGRLTFALGLQPDFQGHFKNELRPRAILHNYDRLKPALRTIGITLTDIIRNAVVAKRKGAIGRLLNRIKANYTSFLSQRAKLEQQQFLQDDSLEASNAYAHRVAQMNLHDGQLIRDAIRGERKIDQLHDLVEKEEKQEQQRIRLGYQQLRQEFHRRVLQDDSTQVNSEAFSRLRERVQDVVQTFLQA